jgi:hypothetical protein
MSSPTIVGGDIVSPAIFVSIANKGLKVTPEKKSPPLGSFVMCAQIKDLERSGVHVYANKGLAGFPVIEFVAQGVLQPWGLSLPNFAALAKRIYVFGFAFDGWG